MDARSWDRLVVEKEVPCSIAGLKEQVFLYDLSAGGCMVEMAVSRDALGLAVAVELYALETVPGQVVWQSGHCIGVRFGEPIHDAVVRHVGFNPPEIAFEDQAPRDRFGRILPRLDAGGDFRSAARV